MLTSLQLICLFYQGSTFSWMHHGAPCSLISLATTDWVDHLASPLASLKEPSSFVKSTTMPQEETIAFKKTTADITAQFEVSGVKNLLFNAVGSKTLNTHYLTPGFRFEIYPFSRPPLELKCRIRAKPGDVRPPYKVELTCSSLNGNVKYQTCTTTRNACTTETRDWCTILTQEIYNTYEILRKEDALLISVTLTYSPGPMHENDAGVQTVFRHTRGQVKHDLRSVAYKKIHNSGKLSSPDFYHASTNVLKDLDIDISKCKFRTLEIPSESDSVLFVSNEVGSCGVHR